MLHLQSNGIIHRDLAARNVLIGSRTDSGYRAKVSDFGLSRQGHAYYFNPNDQKKRPVKWTAPEALAYNRYSAASDVWSFGIVLWEMSSHGMDPYPTMTVQEVFAAVQRGYRLERPPSCPDFMSDAMQACWASDPHERPTWNSLLDSLCDLSEDDVLALLVASPPSSSNQINETLARGRELRRASKASVRVTKSAVPYSFANRETNVVSAETTEDDAFDSTRLSLSIGSTPRRRDTVEPADSNPLPAAADDQSNDDEAADESSDTSDPDNDFTPAPAPLPQRGGTMALIVDDSNYIVTAPVGATVKLSTTVVLPPSAMAAAAPAAVPAMAPVVPSVQRPAFVEVPDASNYIVASAAAVPFSASRNVGPVRALNESGGKFVRKIGPTTGRSLVDSTSDDELVQTKSSGRRAGRLGPVDDSSATSDDDSMFARGLNSTAKPRGFTVSHVVDGGSTRPWVSTGNSVGSAPSMSSAPLSTSPTPTTVQVASPMASAPSSRRNSKAPSIMFDLSKRPSSPQINAPVRASSDQGRAGIDESSSESDLAGRVTAPKPTGVKGVRFGELMNSYQ
jgi:hypothetical protein